MAKLETSEINSLKEYMAFVEHLRVNHKKPFWYRGCGKSNYELVPSLYRHKCSKTINDYMELEERILDRFRQRSIPFHSRSLPRWPAILWRVS